MAERTWQVSKRRYCDHVRHEVALETEVLYPMDFLPDPPRVLAHRCSDGVRCSMSSKVSCVWSGTNPDFDPFRP